MSKYIDKDKVLEYIIFGVVGKDITCGELTKAIESLPTIDIVRCEECLWQDDCSRMVKSLDGLVSTALTWCSDGERKDDE